MAIILQSIYDSYCFFCCLYTSVTFFFTVAAPDGDGMTRMTMTRV
jgi:hypothetical protein